jgi:hypothetical protein
MRPYLALFLWGALSSPAAEPLHFASGPNQVTLLELYTSEGCSSCPPAEGWLSERVNDPLLWKAFVPVEFHVDYWDRLGWTDRLSTRAFTQREYRYAEAWGQDDHVYTPCFVQNGLEYRPSRDPSPAPTPAGELSLDVGPDGTCRVAFQPRPGSEGGAYEVQLALLGSGLTSHPDTGENRGATLHHEFVVIGLTQGRLGGGATAGVLTVTLHLPPPRVAGARRQAVAAWVTRQGSTVPVQATGGWL